MSFLEGFGSTTPSLGYAPRTNRRTDRSVDPGAIPDHRERSLPIQSPYQGTEGDPWEAETMTRHERLSLRVAIAALVISIVSPFANYYWFQNEVRIRQLKSEAFAVEEKVYGCPNLKTIIFEIQLKNTGVWPIERVRLSIQKTVVTLVDRNVINFLLDQKDLTLYPPLEISVEKRSKDIVVHFKDALPPKSDVVLDALQITNVPPDVIDVFSDMESLQPFVWVSSEVSSFEVPWSFIVDCPTVERLRRASSKP